MQLLLYCVGTEQQLIRGIASPCRGQRGSHSWDTACQWQGLRLPGLPGQVWLQPSMRVSDETLRCWEVWSHMQKDTCKACKPQLASWSAEPQGGGSCMGHRTVSYCQVRWPSAGLVYTSLLSILMYEMVPCWSMSQGPQHSGIEDWPSCAEVRMIHPSEQTWDQSCVSLSAQT